MDEKDSVLTLSKVEIPEHSGNIQNWKTIPEALRYYANKYPDVEAIIFASAEGPREAVTFNDVYEKSQRVAYNLVALGIKPTEIVAINLRTCPEWLYITFGSMMAGAVPFGVSFTFKDGGDLVALMKQLQTCSCLVMDPGIEGENGNIMSKLVESYNCDGSVRSEQMPYLRYLIGHDPEMKMSGVKPLSKLLADDPNSPDLPELQGDDLAGLFQTSGSTGVPKVIAHSHSSMLTTTRLDIQAQDRNPADVRYFNDRPFSWIGGYPFSLIIGSVRVTCSDIDSYGPKDKARFICDIIRKENCQLILFPATVLPEIAAMESLHEDWSSRTVVFGGNPISKSTIAPIKTKCKQLVIAYGGSETLSISSTVVTDVGSYIDYSCGRVTPGVSVKIVDPDENIVPPNTRGEIYVQSKSLFREYYNDPEKTNAAFTDDGWYKTDDIGRLLEDGTLLVEGRKSNLIISGRMNVAPEILEAAIEKCPGVEAVVVVPLLDDVMYQVICACVKVALGSGVDESDIRKFCEDFHSDKRQIFTVLPKYYIFLDQFPMTNTGKVARQTLRSIAEQTFMKNVEGKR